MDLNLMLALVFIGTGLVDFVILRKLGDRLAPGMRTAILLFAIGFIGFGVLMALGRIRLV